MDRITILGAGTWGVALARLFVREGHRVSVWSALPDEIAHLQKERMHPKLPGVVLPAKIFYTPDAAAALSDADTVIFAVPSVYLRTTAEAVKPLLPRDAVIVSVVKGLEAGTLCTMSEILADVLGKERKIAALSGPTHAEEVALDLPTAAVVASSDIALAKRVQEQLGCDNFRLYTNTDIRGVELCGAVKNVMALASGISHGLGYGDNARAAIITRGIEELSRLGEAMECDHQTFFGLAGIGDLVVTASSVHSRNFRAGILIGKGMTAEAAVREIGMVVEGINALDGADLLMKRYHVDMPIVGAVYEIVRNGADPKEMVKGLMGRSLKEEF